MVITIRCLLCLQELLKQEKQATEGMACGNVEVNYGEMWQVVNEVGLISYLMVRNYSAIDLILLVFIGGMVVSIFCGISLLVCGW